MLKIIRNIIFIVVLLLGALYCFYAQKLQIITGYAAKNMSSAHFYANRTPLSITQDDNNIPFIRLAKSNVPINTLETSSNLFGLAERTTVYREGLGSVLLVDGYNDSIWKYKPKRSFVSSDLPFPYGNGKTKDTLFSYIDYKRLNNAVENVFMYPDSLRTRSVLILHKEQIISEKYSKDIAQDTPILGWSMTKSIMATLFGVMESKNRISVDDFTNINEWKNDERKNIRITDLLHMESGLEWEEDYSEMSDVTRMLFFEVDMSSVQKHKKAISKPGKIWNYSSGSTNLLSGLLRLKFNTYQEYLDFPYTQLIDKIGMHSMLLETDLSGNFIASSYGWATTRDWAKFGLLYLNKGKWNNEQIFDPEWVDYITTPNQSSNGEYGAHFYLNTQKKYPDVSADMYNAQGHLGQYVFIIPSKDLVVVRTGLAEAPDFDVNVFLSEIVKSINDF